MKTNSKNKLLGTLLSVAALTMPSSLLAEQTIKLSFVDNDSVKICKAVVMVNDTQPVKKVAVNFFAKRAFGLLPLAPPEKTDESGEASVNFPKGLPGDSTGNVTVIARLEDDEEILDQKDISWGKKVKYENEITQQAIWASRSHAPTYLIIIANAIILGIWGTMGYIVFLLFFRVKKSGINYNP
ncbi:MAG TPA: hypothetical protein VII99_12205 [Bacteroidia bacterium]